MPNQPKTMSHGVRVDRAIWDRALTVAKERGETLPAAIRRFVTDYAQEK